MSELLGSPDTRLLTLTGPGGTGKTQLALQATAEAADHYPDGLFWVPVAPLHDPALMLPTIAQAVGVRERAGEPLVATVTHALAGKTALLFVDNVEHLLPPAATELAALAAECPTLTILTTSRERLRIRVETSWPVPALNVTDGEQLFLERARAAGVVLAADERDTERASEWRSENLEDLEAFEGKASLAKLYSEQSLAVFRELDNAHCIGVCLANLGEVACQEGRYNDAANLLRESLELSRDGLDREVIASCLDKYAAVAAFTGGARRAATLLGAAEALRRETGETAQPTDRRANERTRDILAARFDGENLTAAEASGGAMPLEQAIAVALAP